MPHLRHHRRRHSWPFGSPGAQLRERRIARNSRNEDSAVAEEQYLAPIGSEDLLEDDAASAGIVRTKTMRSHRWFASKHAIKSDSTERHATTGGDTGPSTSPGSLRRIIRPPLDKARSLFVLPATTTAGEQVVISYWVPQPQAADVQLAVEDDMGQAAGDATGSLTVERNHRRCHSEQPRSWKAPSASLWTLSEE